MSVQYYQLMGRGNWLSYILFITRIKYTTVKYQNMLRFINLYKIYKIYHILFECLVLYYIILYKILKYVLFYDIFKNNIVLPK